MRNQLILITSRIQRNFANRLAATQAQYARFGQQVDRLGFDQKIDIEIGRHRHLHPPQTPQHHGVHRRVPQCHNGRARQRPAWTHQFGMKGHARQHALLIQTVDSQVDILGHRQPIPNQTLHLKRRQPHDYPPDERSSSHALHPSCTPLYRHRTMPAYSKP